MIHVLEILNTVYRPEGITYLYISWNAPLWIAQGPSKAMYTHKHPLLLGQPFNIPTPALGHSVSE